jgi:hypothetical protein
MKALVDFIRQLGDELPTADLPQFRFRRNVGLLKSSFTTVDTKGNMIIRKLGRPSKLAPVERSGKYLKLKKMMAKYFGPSWPMKPGRVKG